MASIPYVDYMSLKEVYTIKEAAELLTLSKSQLKEACEANDIRPRRNEIGEWIIVKYDIRKLHNRLYHAGKVETEVTDDPWQ